MPRPYTKRGSPGKRCARGWLDPRKNHAGADARPQCSCGAYPHTHRTFSGRCSLLRWVKMFFDPCRRECIDCLHLDNGECQIVAGLEKAPHCPELRDYVRYEGIKLYGRALEAFQRAKAA